MRALAATLLLLACGSSPPEPEPPRTEPLEVKLTQYLWPRRHARTSDSGGCSDCKPLFVPFLPDPPGGSWERAQRPCEAAAEKDRNDQDNAMVCALAACNARDAAKARKHMARLKSPSRRGMARQTCLKNGVDVPID